MLFRSEIFAGNGIHCQVIDRVAPTPVVMFAVKTMGLDYGMVITASHNPAIYNGVKLFTEGGRDANEEITHILEGYIEKVTDVQSVTYTKGLAQGLIKEFNPQNEYIDSILSLVDVEAIKDARLKIALDQCME